jgi:hypothetical protein
MATLFGGGPKPQRVDNSKQIEEANKRAKQAEDERRQQQEELIASRRAKRLGAAGRLSLVGERDDEDKLTGIPTKKKVG